jgi:hypothetical protein
LTLETVLKDTQKAGEMMKWASQFAKTTPFETDEVVKGTVRLQAYGIEAKNTMRSIGDMAAVMGTDLMQAIEAVADAQTGELERLKEFGITKAMLEKKAGEMYRNQVVVNNQGQIVDQAKFNDALFALMEDRFKGGMEKQATTLKGIVAVVTGTWKEGMSNLVGVTSEGVIRQGSLFELMKTGVSSLSKEMDNLTSGGGVEEFDKMFVAPLRAWVESGGISVLVQGVKDLAGGVWSVLNAGVATYGFFRDNWSLLSPLLYGIVGALASLKAVQMGVAAWQTIMTIRQWGLNAAMTANPVGMIVVGIGALIAMGVLLIRNWDNVELAGKKVWNGVVSAAEWGVNSVIGFINKMISGALDGVNLVIKGINKITGSNIGELEFSLKEANFSGAKFNTEGQSFDWRMGAKKEAAPDDVIAQMNQQQQQAQVHQEQRAGSQSNLVEALDNNTSMMEKTRGGGNTINVTVNGSDLTAEEIADKLVPRIERKLFT